MILSNNMQITSTSRRLLIKNGAVLFSFPALWLALAFVPFDSIPGVCGFYRSTGYPCPTCGMTRALEATAHLNLIKAIIMNPLGPLAFACAGVWWVDALFRLSSARSTRLSCWARAHGMELAVTGFLLVLSYGVLRIVVLCAGYAG
jgi:hypothetical protein